MELFAEENIDSKELQEAMIKMKEQVKEVGGHFTFDFIIDDEGWVARCREFDGIVAGGPNKNPSEKEIMQALIESIKTAFHIPINKLEIKSTEPLPTIKITREIQLA
jgi:hypothetical protein